MTVDIVATFALWMSAISAGLVGAALIIFVKRRQLAERGYNMARIANVFPRVAIGIAILLAASIGIALLKQYKERGNEVNDNDRFDKFTERARKVMSLAQEEAERLQHNYIGTEHLLLGLILEGEGIAAMVLDNLGVELDEVRSAVECIIGRGDRVVLGQIGLTPRAKKVIELAIDEARRLNHHYIGTEHLLLGLVREGEGIAAGVLGSLDVSLEKVRTETIQVLSRH